MYQHVHAKASKSLRGSGADVGSRSLWRSRVPHRGYVSGSVYEQKLNARIGMNSITFRTATPLTPS